MLHLSNDLWKEVCFRLSAKARARAVKGVRINFGNTTYYRSKPGMPRGVPIWAFKG